MVRLVVEAEDLLHEAAKHIHGVPVVLDIGCGIRPQSFFRPDVHLCLDPHQEYLDHIQANSQPAARNLVTIKGGWDVAPILFPKGSVDSIFLLDVIEHVEKETAMSLLKAVEGLCREQIVIFTPLGFLPQDEEEDGLDGWGLHGGHWQAHRSGWTPEDFDERWTILVCEDFHRFDGRGKVFEKPYGAFFAILNLKERSRPGISDMCRAAFDRLETAMVRAGL
jgi:hypothetical protein